MEGFEALQTKKFKNHQLLKTRSKLKEIGFVAEDEEGNKIILSFAKCAFPSEYEKLESLNETDLLNSDLVEKIDSKIRNLSNLENVSVADFSRADQSSNTLISESKILYNSDQLNKINLTCVYPATQKLINKYTDKKTNFDPRNSRNLRKCNPALHPKQPTFQPMDCGYFGRPG